MTVMPVFAYRAADRRGQTIDGVMEAPDARARRRAPAARRLLPDPVDAAGRAPAGSGLAWPEPGGAASPARDLVALTQQLATLVEAGLPLDRALAIQAELAPNAARCAPSWPTCCAACAAAPRWPTRSASTTRGRSRASTSTWCARARRAACSRPRCAASPSSSRSAQEFREALVSALIYPAAAHRRRRRRGRLPDDLRHPALRRPSSRTWAQTIPLPTQILLTVSAAIQSLLVAARRSGIGRRARLAGMCAGDRRAAGSARDRIAAPAAARRRVIAQDRGGPLHPDRSAPCSRAACRCPGASPWSATCWRNQVLGARGRAPGRRRRSGAGTRPAHGRDARVSRRWPSTWCGSARRPGGSRRCCCRSRPTFEADSRKLVKRADRACSSPASSWSWAWSWASSWSPCCWPSSPSPTCPYEAVSCATPRDQRGFTLIELLVVIIVLGPARGPGRPAAVRPRRPVQDGRGPGADRAVRRRARPVPARHRRYPNAGAGPPGAGAESERSRLERALSQKAVPKDPWGTSTSTAAVRATTATTTSGPTAPTAPRRRRRERRRHVLGKQRRMARGFTLLELIVTLVVVALAAASSRRPIGGHRNLARPRGGRRILGHLPARARAGDHRPAGPRVVVDPGAHR